MEQAETSIQLHVVSFSTCPVLLHISPYKCGSSGHPPPPKLIFCLQILVSQSLFPRNMTQDREPRVPAPISVKPAEAQETPAMAGPPVPRPAFTPPSPC